MASLIEELIETLDNEEKIYNELLPVVEQKAQIIIKNDYIPRITSHLCAASHSKAYIGAF